MKKEININNKKLLIKGQWTIDLATKIFIGVLVDSNNKQIMNLNYRIPISFFIKYGTDIVEKDIEDSIKEEILNKKLI